MSYVREETEIIEGEVVEIQIDRPASGTVSWWIFSSTLVVIFSKYQLFYGLILPNFFNDFKIVIKSSSVWCVGVF